MPTKLKLMTVGFGLIMATDLITALRFRGKYNEIVRVALDLDRQNDELRAQIIYLDRLLKEHGIELDEFDLIILNNITVVDD